MLSPIQIEMVDMVSQVSKRSVSIQLHVIRHSVCSVQIIIE